MTEHILTDEIGGEPMAQVAYPKGREYLARYQVGTLTATELIGSKPSLETKDDVVRHLIWICVIASANNKIYEETLGFNAVNWDEENTDPYWAIQRWGLHNARLLGSFIQENKMSLPTGPLWQLVQEPYPSVCREAYEFNREVLLDVYDPTVLMMAIKNENTIVIGERHRFVSMGWCLCDNEYGVEGGGTEWVAYDSAKEISRLETQCAKEVLDWMVEIIEC
ncbi:hypothetical protein OCF84_21605 (plasmid) [Shewanella xiamenensis]|uniref:Uncharacterized protein n=1 Tax=Shewanella xiamenensis TaxID=332186 RepID=A0ABT6UFL3_9GAMM|nr:hypothetical protein [Shewanella xiamenensis]MDI5832525.1 hypothetical protein [Shewanella xiamenensis]WHF57856.1 hypothetical protein OCF84_21605 [Shewanella xiamenensis]